MNNFLTSIVGGLAIPLLALLFKLAYDRWLVGRTKDVIATLDNGKVETFTVHASASDDQVADTVRYGITFKRDVSAALEKLSRSLDGFRLREAPHVDFIVEVRGRTIAIECKNDVEHISEAAIEKFLRAKAGLSKLLLVSRQPVPSTVLDRTHRFIESGQLSYVAISANDDIAAELSKAMRLELHPMKPEITSTS
ncbi:hypothetical protein ACFSQU_08740 [Massilia sp. GCM10020059]|uniref:Restriction endonuclease type IV Mrr domain-containing protein n=1 Tax=Massilia agrisoli TaxID=2892444 RepID=A0ABS8IVL8_9BURK|nr:hypothetical protein [Massilia agrisoli]MCC6072516.1 hypothetical protein [Massilia agrisoli]